MPPPDGAQTFSNHTHYSSSNNTDSSSSENTDSNNTDNSSSGNSDSDSSRENIVCVCILSNLCKRTHTRNTLLHQPEILRITVFLSTLKQTASQHHLHSGTHSVTTNPAHSHDIS